MSDYEIPSLSVIWLRAGIAGVFVLALLYLILGASIWIILAFCVPFVWAGAEVIYLAYRVDRQWKNRVG